MRNIQKVFLNLLLCLLIIASSAVAEETQKKEKEKEEAQLEEIVVTATRTEMDVEAAPGSVSVVTKKDMEIRGVRSVDEALNTIAGAYSRFSKGGETPYVTLRGIPGVNRTLLLMDGVILSDVFSGSHLSSLAIAPENIERIEVVRGPASSLYGGYAMGGVVNIITKMPEKREFTLKTGYGSSWDRGEGLDDLRTFYLSYGDKFKDKLSTFLSYRYKSTNGYPTVDNLQKSMPPAGITGWTQTTDRLGDTRYLIGSSGDKTYWDDNITVKLV